MTPLLEAEVGHPPRLQPVRLVAQAGERIAVVGPNGSGKTSLLRALAGIESPRRSRGGEIPGKLGAPSPEVPAFAGTTVGGERLLDVPSARRRRLLSFLPASREVSWPIPVRDLVALGLDQPNDRRVEQVLAQLDLRSLADRAIDSLSTGERARALLARALVAEPRLLLLDEPLSNLDPAWVLRILDQLQRAAERGAALLLSLHDLSLLGRFTRVLLMEGGALRFDGPPAELIGSPLLGEVFGVEPDGAGWKLSPAAGRRSSP